MVLFVPLLLVAYFVGLPLAMWSRSLEGARRNWPARVAGVDHVAQGSYRDADVPRLGPAGAPRVVHFAALGAWILGTMFLPGLALGLSGLAFMGVGAISIPGLVLAWRNFFLAGPLLRGEWGAAQRARSAARFTRTLNYVVLAACVIGAVLGLGLLVDDGIGRNSSGVSWLAGSSVTAVYALISMLHARLLDRAADQVDALVGHAASAARGVRVDAAEFVNVASAPGEPIEQAAVTADEAARGVAK